MICFLKWRSRRYEPLDPKVSGSTHRESARAKFLAIEQVFFGVGATRT